MSTSFLFIRVFSIFDSGIPAEIVLNSNYVSVSLYIKDRGDEQGYVDEMRSILYILIHSSWDNGTSFEIK